MNICGMLLNSIEMFIFEMPHMSILLIMRELRCEFEMRKCVECY